MIHWAKLGPRKIIHLHPDFPKPHGKTVQVLLPPGLEDTKVKVSVVNIRGGKQSKVSELLQQG